MTDSISVQYNSRLKSYRKNYQPETVLPRVREILSYCL
nr:MAG TPA: hypothetical protein [Caudoviricetes sp.]